MNSFSNMSHDEMRELISAYIDDECTKEEKKFLEERIKSDSGLRKLYDEEKQVKKLLQTRLEKYKAPAGLKQQIQKLITEEENLNNSFTPAPLTDQETENKQTEFPLPTQSYSFSKFTSYKLITENKGFGYIVSIAAVLLVILGLGYYQVQNFEANSQQEKMLEARVYEHFNQHNAEMIEPTISSVSRSETQKELADRYELDIAIPAIEDTEFKGVVYSDFYGDMKAPLLEYYCNNSGEMIYIFAFKVDDIEAFEQLKRDHKAKDTCRDKKDYHITELNDKQIVSWKWDNIWYTAISNQSGDLLATRVDPLN